MPKRTSLPEEFYSQMPEVGREIELELDAQEARLKYEQECLQAELMLMKNPKSLLLTLNFLEKKYGQILKDINEEKKRLILSRMSPEELKAFEKAKEKIEGYKISPKDLPTDKELKEMGVEKL